MATPRSNSACAVGSQEVGKVTLPSFSSCWPIAPLASAAVIRPAANKVRPDCVFIVTLLSGLRERWSASLLGRSLRLGRIYFLGIRQGNQTHSERRGQPNRVRKSHCSVLFSASSLAHVLS